MWLIPILPIIHWYFRITQFSVSLSQRTAYPLCQVRQFVQKSFYIQIPIHVSVQLYQKVTWAIGLTNHITISLYVLTFQSTMNNIHRDLVTWEKVIQKPRGNILTGALRITVSTNVENRHVPQCRNQTNELMKTSLWVLVIPTPPYTHSGDKYRRCKSHQLTHHKSCLLTW